jgi:hypothetical protein
MNGTSAALAGIAANISPRQAQPITQEMHQQRSWFNIPGVGCSIHFYRNFSHRNCLLHWILDFRFWILVSFT